MANTEHLAILREGVKVWNDWREKDPGIVPDLSHAILNRAILKRANLARANLAGSNLYEADLYEANLAGADLTGANLTGAILFGAALLSRAKLSGADLNRANLRAADLEGAAILTTVFADVDLSRVKGLETVKHLGPSEIGIGTIFKSGGNIPELFLRGCGVPETMITFVRSLIGTPIQFFSAFISYSSKDDDFAQRLYADLQARGVRVWLAPEDLRMGAKIRPGIDEAVRSFDKLIVILSKHCVSSQWVELVVDTALARERGENRIVLFPIRVDNAVLKIEGAWPALLRNTRDIGDFSNWKSQGDYQKALDQLLHDLKALPEKGSA